MAGIGRKRKKTRTPIGNRGHSHVDSNRESRDVLTLADRTEEDENTDPSRRSLFTPPSKTRRVNNNSSLVLGNNTRISNRASNNNDVSETVDYLQRLADDLSSGDVCPDAIATKILELMDLALDTDEDFARTLSLLHEELGMNDDAPNIRPPTVTAKSDVQPISYRNCLLYTSPSPRDQRGSRMPSSA